MPQHLRRQHLPHPPNWRTFLDRSELYYIPTLFKRITDHLAHIRLGSDVQPCIWSLVEVCAGIVCACLPTFRPLFDKKVRGKRSQQSNEPKSNSFVSLPSLPLPSFGGKANGKRGIKASEVRHQLDYPQVRPDNWAKPPLFEQVEEVRKWGTNRERGWSGHADFGARGFGERRCVGMASFFHHEFSSRALS